MVKGQERRPNPWRELRAREHLDFVLAPLPHQLGSVFWPRDERVAIVIDPVLSRRDRKAALAHELVHDERGGGAESPGMPSTWAAVAARDELQVEAEVARWLVPLGRLAEVVELHVANELPVEAWRIADDFDVPEAVASRALQLLGRKAGL